MLACRPEGRGGVVAKCLAVPARTRRRSARKATDRRTPSATKTPTSLASPPGDYQYALKSGGLWGRKEIKGASTESRVRGNLPARFGAGERPQGPTYRY